MNENSNKSALSLLLLILTGLIIGVIIFFLSFYSFRYEYALHPPSDEGILYGWEVLLCSFVFGFIGGCVTIISAQPKSLPGRDATPIAIGMFFTSYFGFLFINSGIRNDYFAFFLIARIWLALAISYLFGMFFSFAARKIQKQ